MYSSLKFWAKQNPDMGKVFSYFYIDMVKWILKQLHVFTCYYICIYENVYHDDF